MMNEKTKTMLQSKTVGTAVLAPILSFVLSAVGLEVPAEIQVSIIGVVMILLRKISSREISSWF